MENREQSPNRLRLRLLGFAVLAALIGGYLYALHTGAAQRFIESVRDLGVLGVLIGILIQSAVNIVPVPGEFISIILMEIYGPVWGGVWSGISGLTGAIGALYLTRWLSGPFFDRMANPFLQKLDTFIHKHGAFGLLLIRFVPFVPYHIVNYGAGLLRVRTRDFIWTTALGILPYTVAMSGLYAGVRRGSLVWGAIGGGLSLLMVLIGWYLKKRGS